MRCHFSTSIFKSACIRFIVSGGYAPSVLYPMQIGLNKPPISPFWVVCSSLFLNGWALPKSSLNNDAHNRSFCTSAQSQPISKSSWLHKIHFYIPHQLISYILAIRSLYNLKRLSGESIHCWFLFVARLSQPRSHIPYDTFYNHTIWISASPRRSIPCNLLISCNIHYHSENITLTGKSIQSVNQLYYLQQTCPYNQTINYYFRKSTPTFRSTYILSISCDMIILTIHYHFEKYPLVEWFHTIYW